jgi:maltooligosyltrehalose synthase
MKTQTHWVQSDYYDIHPPFGTMDDVHHLIAELKRRGMKLVMDFVVNHTSTEVRNSTLTAWQSIKPVDDEGYMA